MYDRVSRNFLSDIFVKQVLPARANRTHNFVDYTELVRLIERAEVDRSGIDVCGDVHQFSVGIGRWVP